MSRATSSALAAPPLTFGSGRRLRRHLEFVRAQRTGRRVATPHFTLLVAKQPVADATEALSQMARMGMVVSSKVGSAVRRNRIKRVCRECFRAWPDLLPHGVDLVVIARVGAHELSPTEVRGEWMAVRAALQRRAAEALARRPMPNDRTPRAE
jgi:ribonuclease P protein component